MQNKKKIILFSAVVVLIGLGIFIWWLFWGRFEDFTRDAYVHGNQVRLTPQISGYVSAVYCKETQYVEQGQILVTLDETDNKIAFNKAVSDLALTIREVTELFENVYRNAAIVKEREAEFMRAEVDFIDREALVPSGAVSKEDYIHSKTTLEGAAAALEAAFFNLRKAVSLVENTTVQTHPKVLAAADVVKRSYVNLQRCIIKAPASGIIAQRGVQVGEAISPSSQLLAIVPLDEIWVDANYKEIHMDKIRIGQQVSMTSDFYGSSVVYNGTVLGIAGGTGAVFSPIPPQNATGNWIKIVQRVPVRVSLDSAVLKKYPLRLGLSMNVTINVKDVDGLKLPTPIKDQAPLWETNVFKEQEKGSQRIIDEIFRQNRTFAGMISEEVRVLARERK
ncbi:MAG: putative multidrug resistance protein EmrK [Chlamydiia bacterium]|nr:putative multidrug resistance protein EmrK [Chlamydiia bacterium]